jgi:hypothetical protein
MGKDFTKTGAQVWCFFSLKVDYVVTSDKTFVEERNGA